MDPQLIITGLAGTVVTLAVTFFKFLVDTIAEQKTTIKELTEREQKRLHIQDATTTTLQAVVDQGLERLRRESPPEASP